MTQIDLLERISIISRGAAVGPALLNAARALSCDRITGEVAVAMNEASIPVIVLKGPSVARWLYPAGGRGYGDSDLLVPASEFSRAGGVLRSLGFSELLAGFHPCERQCGQRGERGAETPFTRRGGLGRGPDGIVDLHRNLPRLTVSDDVVWDAFSSGARTALVGGVRVRVPGLAALALHVVLHASQHGFQGHTDEDLRRALQVMPADDWRGVADLATKLGASGALGYGLRQYAAGAVIADRLGLPSLPPADPRIWAKSTPKGSQALIECWTAPTLRAKAQRLRWMVFPSPAKIRYLSPLPAVSHRALPRLYAAYWWDRGRCLGSAAVTAARIVRDHHQHATGGRDASGLAG